MEYLNALLTFLPPLPKIFFTLLLLLLLFLLNLATLPPFSYRDIRGLSTHITLPPSFLSFPPSLLTHKKFLPTEKSKTLWRLSISPQKRKDWNIKTFW